MSNKKQKWQPYGRAGFTLSASLFILSGILVFFLQPPRPAAAASGPRCYVKAGASTPDGNSWATAYATVQDALADTNCTEIWVAAGVYYPDEGAGQTDDNRASTFTLKNGVALYGGFAGTETARDQRNPAAHVTVLSGDIDKNDTTDASGVVTDTAKIAGSNAYHVVTGSSTDNTAVLDGFTITAGQANETSFIDSNGGGMYNYKSSPTLSNVTFSANSAYNNGGGMYNLDNSSPTLTEVAFSGNVATSYGGGMYNNQSSPTLTEVAFSDNVATSYGGGMYNESNSRPTLTKVTFSANSAQYGGGMYNYQSSPTLSNVTFSANSAYNNGGGMYNLNNSNPTLTEVAFSGNEATSYGGGMYNYQSSPTLTDVTFSANSAYNYGGGMYNEYNSSPTLTKVTFSANVGNTNGGGMYNSGSSPALNNVTFSVNSAVFGGGMYNSGSSPTLTNVTFSANSAYNNNGGGMYNTNSSSPTLTNVIVANSTSGGDCVNGSGGSIATGSSNNLIEDSANACGLTHGSDSNIIGSDPKLGALTDFGGPGKQVFPLLSGSPAIDAGTNSGCPPTDQRGAARPSGAFCDIGAYEGIGFVWDGGGGDNNWSTAANWSGDAVPGATDDVYFDG
ncbi:MAG: hypothetical protein DDG59_04770, partial [Anaerolineae bacterium]